MEQPRLGQVPLERLGNPPSRVELETCKFLGVTSWVAICNQKHLHDAASVSGFTSWSHCIAEVRPSGEDVGFRARGLDVHAQASAGPQSPLATQGQAAPSAGTRDLGAIRRRESLGGAHFLHSIVARGCPTPRNRPPTTCRWGMGRRWQPGAKSHTQSTV